MPESAPESAAGSTPEGASSPMRFLRAAGQALLAQPRALAWLAPLAWATLIFWLSSSHGPVEDLPVIAVNSLMWNLAHPVVFGLLAVLVVPVLGRRGLGRARWTAMTGIGALWITAAVTLYGFTDELHQSTVPGRDASLFDVLSDGVGAACALALVVYLGREDASRTGFGRRLLVGALLSLAAAALATAWDVRHGEGLWPF